MDSASSFTQAREDNPIKTLPSMPEMDLYWGRGKEVRICQFELRAGQDLFGTLRFKSPFSSLAIAESANGTWVFTRVDLLKPFVTVRAVNDEDSLAIYMPRKGILEFFSGSVFGWQTTGFGAIKHQFNDANGNPSVIFESVIHKSRGTEAFEPRVLVKINPRGHALSELSLLITIGWYLIVLQQGNIGFVLIPL